MNARETIIEYINAMQENDERNLAIEKGLSLLCEDTPLAVDSMTYRLYRFYDDLMIHTFGQETFNWIMWYLYDSVISGKKVMIDGEELGSTVEHVIDTPEKLYDICITRTIDEHQSDIQAACGGLSQTPMEF
jgi:hypothetical protein